MLFKKASKKNSKKGSQLSIVLFLLIHLPNETILEEQESPQHVLFLGRHVDKDILTQEVFLLYLTHSSEKFLKHTVRAQTAVRKSATINIFL